MKVTPSQLKWMRAIHDFYLRDHWYPGLDDLLEPLGNVSTNAGKEMVERLARAGLAKWPLTTKHPRNPSTNRLIHRPNSIRLTALGIKVLQENS